MKSLSRRALLSLAFAASATAAGMMVEARGAAASGTPASVPADRSRVAQAPGRYKKIGNACVWTANDSGPNQCTPLSEGRFRRDGRACVWDAAGRGPNQCRPTSGRFKKEGNTCVWNSADTGRNQCDPRQPK